MKGYNRTGLLLAGILAVLATVLVSVQPVMSTENATGVSASVTVGSDIDVTMSDVTLTFGSLSPGDSNQQPTEFPINVTIHGTTNTNVNLSVNGSATFVSGGNNFAIGNLSYTNQSGGTYTDMTTTYAFGTPNHADWKDISDPSADTNRSVYTQLDIPSAQPTGAYTATVSIRVSDTVV